MADHARALGRHELAPLGDAERGVGVVGFREALDHLLGAGGAEGVAFGVGGALVGAGRGRAVDLERHLPPAEPALGRDLAEIADMVGMEMGEEHGVDLGRRHVERGELGPGARPGIDDHHLAAGDHRGAGVGAGEIRHRRAGAADEDMQRVVLHEGGVGVPRDLPRHAALDDAVLHPRHEPDQEKPGDEQRRDSAEDDGKAAHGHVSQLPPGFGARLA